MSKNTIAYILLIFTTLFWSGNFIVGKAASLFEIPPFTLNFYRWLCAWLILAPFTLSEIFKKRILNLVNNAKYLFPELSEHHDEWLGFRPSLPDFLPIIGPSKNYKNLFYAFGHHHLGLTLGAITGKIIAGILAEENTNLNLAPYSSLRFG